MANATTQELIQAVREEAHPLRGEIEDYDPLQERVGDARFVLIDEASHGTHEVYQERPRITAGGLQLEPTSEWRRGELPETFPSAA